MINGLRRLRRIIADRVGKKIGRKARGEGEEERRAVREGKFWEFSVGFFRVLYT